jgi:hypothetical protein
MLYQLSYSRIASKDSYAPEAVNKNGRLGITEPPVQYLIVL